MRNGDNRCFYHIYCPLVYRFLRSMRSPISSSWTCFSSFITPIPILNIARRRNFLMWSSEQPWIRWTSPIWPIPLCIAPYWESSTQRKSFCCGSIADLLFIQFLRLRYLICFLLGCGYWWFLPRNSRWNLHEGENGRGCHKMRLLVALPILGWPVLSQRTLRDV